MTIFALSALLNIFRLIGAISGIPYQIFTIFQYFVILISIFKIKFLNIKNFDLYLVSSFLSYHVLRVIAEISHQLIVNDNKSEIIIIASSFTGLRILCISILFCKLLTYHPNRKEIIVLQNIVLVLLVYSLSISLLQNPFIYGASWLEDLGGNITSGNHLGIYRSNGGLGGTVIMYANYLVLTLYYIHFTNLKRIQVNLLTIFYFLSIALCFSRSVFLIMAILFLYRRFAKVKIYHFVVLSGLLIIGLIYADTVLNSFSSIWETYDVMRGKSDNGRIDGWAKSINHNEVTYHMFGVETGRNTGLLTGGVDKLNADGYILAHYYDFGIIGVLLLNCILIRSFIIAFENKYDGLAYSASFLLLLFINSGFDKIFIVTYLFMILIYIKNREVLNSVT